MDIRQCTVEEFFALPGVDELLAEYAAESSIDGMPAPSPCREIYSALEASGAMRAYLAMAGDTVLGFATLLVSRNPHYSAVIGVTESMFVGKCYRASGAGIALIRHVKAQAKEMGAVGFLMSAPYGGQLAQVLGRMDCVETNRVFFWSLA